MYYRAFSPLCVISGVCRGWPTLPRKAADSRSLSGPLAARRSTPAPPSCGRWCVAICTRLCRIPPECPHRSGQSPRPGRTSRSMNTFERSSEVRISEIQTFENKNAVPSGGTALKKEFRKIAVDRSQRVHSLLNGRLDRSQRVHSLLNGCLDRSQRVHSLLNGRLDRDQRSLSFFQSGSSLARI